MRLDAIGYWDFVPIPKTAEDESNPEEEEDSPNSKGHEEKNPLASFERTRSKKGKGIQGRLA